MKIIRGYPATVALSFVVLVWFVAPYFIWKAEAGATGANITSYLDSLWYGIVTMLTVGYGDRYAVTSDGRLWASFMMLVGVFGMGILTAKISSIFLEKALRDRRGVVDSESLNKHFIICGWKSEMSSLLTHILASTDIPATQIVLVNNAPDSEIETMHEFPHLKKVKVVRGDFFQADILKRAAPEKAQKVLIIADATPGPDGAVPTRTEADARTVMTAMILANLAKSTPVAAEILDSQMDQYLRLAHVHEIIYSRDYSRLLLALASTGTGVTNIFHDLLDPSSPYLLTTTVIPPEGFNITFAQLRVLLQRQNPDFTLLGLLENSGNGHQAKEMALKKAQQTPNISKLVENLKSVKSLRFNHPLFSPPDDYVIPEGSMAIVIRRRGSNASLHP